MIGHRRSWISNPISLSSNYTLSPIAATSHASLPSLPHCSSTRSCSVPSVSQSPSYILSSTRQQGVKASPLFILLVNISARYVSDAYFGEFADELPVEFVVAVLKRQRELGGEEARRIEEEWREREDDWRNGFHWVEWVA
jgi:hypothetical protein